MRISQTVCPGLVSGAVHLSALSPAALVLCFHHLIDPAHPTLTAPHPRVAPSCAPSRQSAEPDAALLHRAVAWRPNS